MYRKVDSYFQQQWPVLRGKPSHTCAPPPCFSACLPHTSFLQAVLGVKWRAEVKAFAACSREVNKDVKKNSPDFSGGDVEAPHSLCSQISWAGHWTWGRFFNLTVTIRQKHYSLNFFAAFILLLLATLLFFSRSDSVLLNTFIFLKKKEKVVLWSPSKRVTLPNFLFMLELQHHVSTDSWR